MITSPLSFIDLDVADFGLVEELAAGPEDLCGGLDLNLSGFVPSSSHHPYHRHPDLSSVQAWAWAWVSTIHPHHQQTGTKKVP